MNIFKTFLGQTLCTRAKQHHQTKRHLQNRGISHHIIGSLVCGVIVPENRIEDEHDYWFCWTLQNQSVHSNIFHLHGLTDNNHIMKVHQIDIYPYIYISTSVLPLVFYRMAWQRIALAKAVDSLSWYIILVSHARYLMNFMNYAANLISLETSTKAGSIDTIMWRKWRECDQYHCFYSLYKADYNFGENELETLFSYHCDSRNDKIVIISIWFSVWLIMFYHHFIHRWMFYTLA